MPLQGNTGFVLTEGSDHVVPLVSRDVFNAFYIEPSEIAASAPKGKYPFVSVTSHLSGFTRGLSII